MVSIGFLSLELSFDDPATAKGSVADHRAFYEGRDPLQGARLERQAVHAVTQSSLRPYFASRRSSSQSFGVVCRSQSASSSYTSRRSYPSASASTNTPAWIIQAVHLTTCVYRLLLL